MPTLSYYFENLASPPEFEYQLKRFKLFFREVWVSDPGTCPIGFVSKFFVFWWYLCVRNTDSEPNRAKDDFGTPLPKKILKYARILLGLLSATMHCLCKAT